jgi:glycyl-tRNA synthetase alpha subunit
MAKELDKKQTVDLKELLMSEVIQSEALINLLDMKGIISKEELLEEIKRVNATMLKADK